MKSKLNIKGLGSGELEISKEDIEAFTKFFSDATPGFIKHNVGIWNDNAKIRRIQNIIKIVNKTKEIAKKYNLETKSLQLNISVPFIEVASLEEDESMQKLWANLLANTTSGKIIGRSLYISILKELTPHDASVLNLFYLQIQQRNVKRPSAYRVSRHSIAHSLKIENFETEIVLENLIRQRLIKKPKKRNAQIPMSFGGGLTQFRTLNDQNIDPESLEIWNFLKEDQRNSEDTENIFELTAIGYSLLIACNEPDIDNKSE